jgi:hypothetical protein
LFRLPTCLLFNASSKIIGLTVNWLRCFEIRLQLCGSSLLCSHGCLLHMQDSSNRALKFRTRPHSTAVRAAVVAPEQRNPTSTRSPDPGVLEQVP